MPKNKKRTSASSRRNRRSQKGSKPPSGYVCDLCGKPGHWKNQCILAPFPPFYSPKPGTPIKVPTSPAHIHTHAPAARHRAVYGWTEAEADAAAALEEVVGRPSYVHGQSTAGRGASRPAVGRGVKFPGEHKLVHGWTVKQAEDAARQARRHPTKNASRRRGAHMREFLARHGGRRRKTRRRRSRRRKGGGLLDQLKKGVNAVGAAVRKAAGFEKKPKTRALTPEEVAELQRSTQRRLKSASNANEEGRRNAAMAGPSPVAGAGAHRRTGKVDPRTGYYTALRLRSRMDPGTTARAVADDLGEDVGLSGREDSYEFINNNTKRRHSNSSWKSRKIAGVDGVLYKENKR